MSNAELSNENLIAVGLFSLVHQISETRVRKSPRDEEADNIQAVRNEANIYALLGDDDHIAPCVSTGPGMGHVDLKWAVNGTLEDYIKTKKDLVTDAFRLRTARWIIEAVQLIHTRGIIHSDLCLRQFLIYEDGLAKALRFCNIRLQRTRCSGSGECEPLHAPEILNSPTASNPIYLPL